MRFVGAHPVGDGLQGDAVVGIFHAHRPQGWGPTPHLKLPPVDGRSQSATQGDTAPQEQPSVIPPSKFGRPKKMRFCRVGVGPEELVWCDKSPAYPACVGTFPDKSVRPDRPPSKSGSKRPHCTWAGIEEMGRTAPSRAVRQGCKPDIQKDPSDKSWGQTNCCL